MLIKEQKKEKEELFKQQLTTAERMYNLTIVDFCEIDDEFLLVPSDRENIIELKEMTGYGIYQDIDSGLLESFYRYAIEQTSKRNICIIWSEKEFYEKKLKVFKANAYTPCKEKALNLIWLQILINNIKDYIMKGLIRKKTQINKDMAFNTDMKQDSYYEKWWKKEQSNISVAKFKEKLTYPLEVREYVPYETLLVIEQKKEKEELFKQQLANAERMYYLTSIIDCFETGSGRYITSSNVDSLLELKEMTGYGIYQNIDGGLLESFYKYAIKHASEEEIFPGWSEKRFYKTRLKTLKTYAYASHKEEVYNINS